MRAEINMLAAFNDHLNRLQVFEAPFCCSLAGIKLFQNLNDKIENRPVWQRATLYLV